VTGIQITETIQEVLIGVSGNGRKYHFSLDVLKRDHLSDNSKNMSIDKLGSMT